MRDETLDANDSVEAFVKEKHPIPSVIAVPHFAVIPSRSCQGASEYRLAATSTSHRGTWPWNGEFDA